MQIVTKIASYSVNTDKGITLEVTMKDCEGFTINEFMNVGQAESYLDELNASVAKTKEFLNR